MQFIVIFSNHYFCVVLSLTLQFYSSASQQARTRSKNTIVYYVCFFMKNFSSLFDFYPFQVSTCHCYGKRASVGRLQLPWVTPEGTSRHLFPWRLILKGAPVQGQIWTPMKTVKLCICHSLIVMENDCLFIS